MKPRHPVEPRRLNSHKDIAERLSRDTVFYAEHLVKIVDKERQTVPLVASKGQEVLDAMLERQRAEGKPQRVIALKSRQVGVSTWAQAKLIQRATQRANFDVVTLAHDRVTGAMLFRMGKRMYDNLPEDQTLKPEQAATRRGKEMHFLNNARSGGSFPDSTYLVDTAGESAGGRGGTYMGIHGSEVAFWDDLEAKLASLLSAVPDDPESIVILESTANGHNAFKTLWDKAMDGHSEFAPYFRAWWQEEQYALPFANEEEKSRFRVGDTDQSPYADGELALFDPGPQDYLTGEHFPLTLEQLHWRRRKKASLGEKFPQEYPATPEEAFIATSRQVFDGTHVRQVLIETKITDPVVPTPEHPGPARGQLVAAATETRSIGSGTLEVPTAPRWIPESKLTLGQQANWRIWGEPPFESQYVLASDVSGEAVEDGYAESAFDAIQVIDHKTRQQVAEWEGRTNPDLLAEQIYLACLMFNMPWVGVEITGGWGLPVVNRLWVEGYRYPYLFQRKSPESRKMKKSDRLGWDTNRTTKPMMEALTAQMLREGTHGIKSRKLAGQIASYIRNSKGKSMPEPGKFSDLFMAWQIAQIIAEQQPIKQQISSGIGPRQPREPALGW